MTICIYDANGIQLCCCIGMVAALAYLQLFKMEADDVIIEAIPLETSDQR